MPGTKKRYRVLTEDGAEFVNRTLDIGEAVEPGSEVDLEIYASAARSTVAAGWLEEVQDEPSKERKGGEK